MTKDPSLRVVPPSDNLREEDIDSAVATVESSSRKGNLKLRSDLLTAEGPPGQIRVRAPESSTWFSIYDMEWRIAKVLDGSRSLSEIARDMARFGIAADPKLVRSFAKELKGYGFLEQGAATVDQPLPEQSIEADGTSVEAQQFLNTAMALQAKGDLQGACNYLLAFLEIEPTNHSVRDLLRQLHHEMAEVEQRDSRRPSQILDDEPGMRRSTLTSEEAFRRPTLTDETTMRRPTMDETGSRRPPMMEDQRRSTLVESSEFRFPTMTEQAPVVVSQSSNRLPLIAGIFIGAAILSVVFVFGNPFEASSTKSKESTTTPPPKAPDPTPPSVPGTAIAVQLQSASQPAATVTSAGVIHELLVSSGDKVKSGQQIGTLIDAESHAKIEKLKADIQRFSKKGRRDPVIRHYKQKAEQNLTAAKKKAQRKPIVSSASGSLQLAVAVGEAVAAGAIVAQVGNPGDLVGKAPTGLLPTGYRHMRCEARLPKGTDVFPCSLKPADAQTVQIFVTDADGALSAQDWVEVSFGQ